MTAMKSLLTIGVLCGGAILLGCGTSGDSPAHDATGGREGPYSALAPNAPGPTVKVPPGPPPRKLVIKDLKEGSGKKAEIGDEIVVEYVGINWRGEKYSNSWAYRSEKPSFDLGQNQLVRGFERGILGMRAGGRRLLLVPTRLTNVPGVRVSPKAIPLVFLADMVAVH